MIIMILLGILSFPAGWDNDEVRAICGEEVSQIIIVIIRFMRIR